MDYFDVRNWHRVELRTFYYVVFMCVCVHHTVIPVTADIAIYYASSAINSILSCLLCTSTHPNKQSHNNFKRLDFTIVKFCIGIVSERLSASGFLLSDSLIAWK